MREEAMPRAKDQKLMERRVFGTKAFSGGRSRHVA